MPEQTERGKRQSERNEKRREQVFRAAHDRAHSGVPYTAAEKRKRAKELKDLDKKLKETIAKRKQQAIEYRARLKLRKAAAMKGKPAKKSAPKVVPKKSARASSAKGKSAGGGGGGGNG